MSGVEGWGRHLCDGSATAARQHSALTHQSNLYEIVGVVMNHTVPLYFSVSLAQTGTADWWPQGRPTRGSYTVRSRSSAKKIPASQRASATTAIFIPRGAAIRSALSSVLLYADRGAQHRHRRLDPQQPDPPDPALKMR